MQLEKRQAGEEDDDQNVRRKVTLNQCEKRRVEDAEERVDEDGDCILTCSSPPLGKASLFDITNEKETQKARSLGKEAWQRKMMKAN